MKFAIKKINVTPDRPCRMAGYNRAENSTGVLDPIEINAIAVEVRGEQYIIGILDCIHLNEEFCSSVRMETAKKLSLDPEHITISAIHSHSAPSYFKMTFEDNVVEPDLVRQIHEQMVHGLTQAAASMTEGSVTMEKAQIEGLYGNRNIKGGAEDKQVSLFRFYNKEGKLSGALFHLSAHPTILNGSNYLLSADLIGHVRAKLQDALGCPVAVVNGCCGDVSTRFYRSLSGTQELEFTAGSIVEQFFAKKKPCVLTGDSASGFSFRLTSRFDAATDPDWKRLLAEVEQDDSPMRDFFLERLERKKNFGAYDLDLIAQIRRFGNLLIVVLPGDVLSKFGLQIKKAFPELEVMIICYSNTYCNYLVPEDEYGLYFETFNSRLAKGEADRFIQEVIRRARQLS